MKVDYVTHSGDDLLVANSARVSFNKHKTQFDQGDANLIAFLARNNHWTPFSHPSITLRMKAPIFIRTQCFKHKIGFVENEISRRYVDDEPEFFWPTEWRGRPTESAKQGSSVPLVTAKPAIDYDYEIFIKKALEVYNEMLSDGVAPEQARMVLPQSMYTEWYWTGSLASYARFFRQRIDPHAQKEIQELAAMVGEIIEPLFPVSWKVLTT